MTRVWVGLAQELDSAFNEGWVGSEQERETQIGNTALSEDNIKYTVVETSRLVLPCVQTLVADRELFLSLATHWKP